MNNEQAVLDAFERGKAFGFAEGMKSMRVDAVNISHESVDKTQNNRYEPVAWMQTWENQDGELKHTVNIEQIGKQDIPLYTHPVKELNDGGEPVKNATYWKRQHDNLLMKLNTCAVKLSELEKKLDTRTRELISASFYEHDYKTMMADSEPVAWMDKESGVVCKEVYATEMPNNLIPLYTHPAKLTDGQIMQVWWDANDITDDDTVIEFARAILRKAQER